MPEKRCKDKLNPKAIHDHLWIMRASEMKAATEAYPQPRRLGRCTDINEGKYFADYATAAYEEPLKL